jgi:hypothetical protein
MKTYIAILLFGVGITNLALAASNGTRLEAGARKSTAFAADIDCDGKPDNIWLEKTARGLTIKTRLSSSKVAKDIPFAISSSSQTAICALPARLITESADFDPIKDADGLELKGIVRSKKCKGLALSGGDCDDIHLYWNHQSRHLGWWRQ